MLAAMSLCRRDLLRFFRQRSRIIGALGTPLIFWALIGSGFNYMGYLFPGTVVQILLFASIFSTISIIQDRQQGFLQGVQCAASVPAGDMVNRLQSLGLLVPPAGENVIRVFPALIADKAALDEGIDILSKAAVSFESAKAAE